LCTGNIDMCAFLDTLTQVMLVTEETENLPLDIGALLEGILSLEGVRNKMLSRSSAEVEYSHGSYYM